MSDNDYRSGLYNAIDRADADSSVTTPAGKAGTHQEIVMLFIPVIRKDTEADSIRNSERIVVSAMREGLAYEKVAEEVAKYKSNGIVTGHKVLDDDSAVKGLIKNVPDHLRNSIVAQKLGAFRMTQLLNRVLRGEFEMVKGKLTGNPSPKRQKELDLRAASKSTTDATAETKE